YRLKHDPDIRTAHLKSDILVLRLQLRACLQHIWPWKGYCLKRNGSHLISSNLDLNGAFSLSHPPSLDDIYPLVFADVFLHIHNCNNFSHSIASFPYCFTPCLSFPAHADKLSILSCVPPHQSSSLPDVALPSVSTF